MEGWLLDADEGIYYLWWYDWGLAIGMPRGNVYIRGLDTWVEYVLIILMFGLFMFCMFGPSEIYVFATHGLDQ